VRLSSRSGGNFEIRSKAADGSGTEKTVIPVRTAYHYPGWSPDGKYLTYLWGDGEKQVSLWIPMKKLFVGNLDFHTSEDELRQLFASYGSVERVDIIKDRDTGQPRGFGFVEMANAAEADRAITELNGRMLGDRAVNINEAHPRPERAERGGQRHRSTGRW
jgi:cold-inducible RNA-binding protein